MQGGYEKYPAQPSPNPKMVGQQLQQMAIEEDEELGAEQESLVATRAPMPSATSAINAGQMSQVGPPSGVLAQIGDALQRVENGAQPIETPERMITATNRFEHLLALGMSPEEAQLMMQTGGA